MEQTILTGAITTKDETGAQITRLILLRCTADSTTNEQILIACDQHTRQAVSATKNCKTTTALTESSWNNMQAALYMQIIQKCLAAVAKCKLLKNGKAPKSSKTQIYSSVSPQGIMLNYVGSVQSYSFEVSKPQIKLNPTHISITGSDGTVISLAAVAESATVKCYNDLINNIPWVETKSQSMTLQDITTTMSEEEELMNRHVKTMEEVALTKDTSWLQYKKYYVIDNEATAEQLISALEQYDGLISYDVETTGLNMNMYCEIGSPLKKQLEEYNASVEPSQRIRADRLTGFSFCVKPNEAYYFPCFHRKFDNLFKDINEPTTAKIVQTIKARYTVGDLRNRNNYMAQFIRSTPAEEWGSDVILMERCRDIFEKHKILAHHGSFEYKVNLCYGCDLNLVEDTMILHQLAFKWKNVRTHSGEPSNLKYLSKTILGIDQLSLEDFFADFKEAEQAAEVRSVSATSKKKKKAKKASIDFSYMGKEETRCYAPADVDLTLQLWYKFKVDAQKEFPDLDYLYGVEIIMACAVGYAEFYGLHINEKKIDNAKYDALVTMAKKEHEIRVLNNLCSAEEQTAFDTLNALDLDTTPHEDLQAALDKLNGIIEAEGNLNLGSPGQVADLLYAKYNWSPDADGKKSMGKKVIKQYEKLKDDEGKPLYPEVLLYRDWKDNSTLITKFFDKLQDFMYPGGNIFTSFGQIACATGRMSSKKPNFQQMPSSITKIIEPRAGYVFFDGDFSQIEYRCLCALAGETSLIEAFNDPDMDYHQKMASLMYDVPYALVPDYMRKSAKTFNFGIPYGMGFQSLAIQLHGNKSRASVDDAKEKYELYFKEQPKVRQFFSDVKEQARYNEYTKTYFGRRRYFKFTDENGNVSEKFVAQGLRQAGNAVIQGCLDGDVRIQTKEYGIVRIKDVVNKTLHVWDGKEWTLGDIMPSGLKQKCIVTFNNGQQFICSPIHKFLRAGANANNTNNYIECKDLMKYDYITYNKFSDLKVEEYDLIEQLGLHVESVEVTDEYIPMYDVCNTERGYYVADGIVTHNTARDVFGIAAARAFQAIRNNGLLGKVRMCNFIHDEVLYEISAEVNVLAVVGMILEAMQLVIPGFPPLYVGGGIGNAWKTAKGAMNEIHPTLGMRIIDEAHQGLLPAEFDGTTDSVYKYFDNKVYSFRQEKVATYIAEVERDLRTGKEVPAIDPAIGKLLGLQFEGGVEKIVNAQIDEYKRKCAEKLRDPDAKKLTGFESKIVPMRLKQFIIDFPDAIKEALIKAGFTLTPESDLNNLMIISYLDKTVGQQYEADEDDVAYDDDNEEEDDFFDFDFELIDESKNDLFGVSIIDIARQFGMAVIPSRGVCCIYIGDKTQKQLQQLANLFEEHQCNPDDKGAMEVQFVRADNYILKPDIFVNELTTEIVTENLIA